MSGKVLNMLKDASSYSLCRLMLPIDQSISNEKLKRAPASDLVKKRSALSARPAPYINPYQASGPGAHHINPPPALLLRRVQIKYITTRGPWSNPVTGQSFRSSLISLITLSSVRSIITQIAHHSPAPDLIDDVLAKHNREAASV